MASGSFASRRRSSSLIPSFDRRWQEAVEPEVDRELAIMIGPVRDRACFHVGARPVPAEERERLAEPGVVERGERGVTEHEALLQPADERLLAVGRCRTTPIGRLGTTNHAAEQI